MKRIAAIAAVGVMMAMPSVALAGSSSTTQAYNKQTTQAKKVLAAHKSRKPTTPSSTKSTVSPASGVRTTSTGSLPFTGLDVGALAAGAIVLLGAGLVLRRVSATERR